MKKRKTYSAGFKTKIVLEVLQERETVQEIAQKYDLHPSQISTWKSQFISNADVVFERGWFRRIRLISPSYTVDF